MNNSDKIKSIIYKKRKSKEYSQEYMASAIGISVNSYRKIESGNTRIIYPRLEKIAGALEISPEELLFDPEAKSNYLMAYENERAVHIKEIKSLKKINANLEDLISLQKEKISTLESSIKEYKAKCGEENNSDVKSGEVKPLELKSDYTNNVEIKNTKLKGRVAKGEEQKSKTTRGRQSKSKSEPK